MQPFANSHYAVMTRPGGRAFFPAVQKQLHSRWRMSIIAWSCLLILLVHHPLQAQSDFALSRTGGTFHVLSSHNELTLTERSAKVVELKNRITRVDGFDPSVLSVQAITPNRIRLQAVSSGVTTLLLVDEYEQTYEVEVFVEGDARHLQSYINRMFPDSSVTVVKLKDSIVLRGVVSDPSHISQVTEIAEQFYPKVINHMQFGSANQVRLQVRIMEAQRSRIRQLGFNWSYLSRSGYISSNPGNLAPPADVTLNSGGANEITYGSAGLSDSSISFGLVNANSIFRGFLEALKQEGLLRILVETSVVADSGRPASLLSGGEFPILVPQALGTLSVEWREFGVKLEAVPIVLGQGQVILEIAPEFSERDFANAATLNNTTIPAITTRRANTQVRMRFGQTLMIGGLIATRYTAETDKVPFLGELPGIGAAFRRVRYDENETELIILVTPEYVAPLDACEVPEGGPGMFVDVPTDRELFWDGFIEVPNYGGPLPPSAHGPGSMPHMHGDPLPMIDPLSPAATGYPQYSEDQVILPPQSAPPVYGPESIPLNPDRDQQLPLMPVLPKPEAAEPTQLKSSDQENTAVPLGPPAFPRLEQEKPIQQTSLWKQSTGRKEVDLDDNLMSEPTLIMPSFTEKEDSQKVSAPNP